jgi:hypothetical protein
MQLSTEIEEVNGVSLCVSHILPLSNPESIGYRYLTEFWLGQSDRLILPWIQLAGLIISS